MKHADVTADLVAAETGGDPATIDFERDYYPAMADHYRTERDATA